MAVRTSVATVLFIVTIVFYPAAIPAMPLQMFDRMAPQDQRDYLKHLVLLLEDVLREQGRPDAAEKVDTAFRKRGSEPSIGEVRFWDALMEYRRIVDWQVEHQFHFTPLVGEVEDALLHGLSSTEIVPDFQLFKSRREFAQVLREKPYWPKRTLRAN